MDGSEQEALIARVRAGDHDAFALLIEPYSLRLLSLLRRIGGRALGADQDHEDLFQVLVARAWGLVPAFEGRGPDSFYRWLVALARNTVSDRLKYVDAKGRGGTRHVESALESSGPRDRGATVTALAACRDEVERVCAALQQLPATQRAVVERHLLEAMNLAEIAAELGITKNAVWERLRRGLTAIRSALAVST